MKLSIRWKLSGGIVILALLGAAAAITLVYHGRAQPLGLDQLPGFNTADRDKSPRDMLSAGSHPFVVFQPNPATIALDPTSTAVQHVRITGDLQVSGVTKPEVFVLDAAAGSTTVEVGDFGVQVPQEVGGFVQVDPRITLEVSLILLKP